MKIVTIIVIKTNKHKQFPKDFFSGNKSLSKARHLLLWFPSSSALHPNKEKHFKKWEKKRQLILERPSCHLKIS